jgi:hypothetical protein
MALRGEFLDGELNLNKLQDRKFNQFHNGIVFHRFATCSVLVCAACMKQLTDNSQPRHIRSMLHRVQLVKLRERYRTDEALEQFHRNLPTSVAPRAADRRGCRQRAKAKEKGKGKGKKGATDNRSKGKGKGKKGATVTPLLDR